MATKIRLAEDTGTSRHLIGIAGPIKDYLLTYHLNKSLDLHLKKRPDLPGNSGTGTGFSFFAYRDPGDFFQFFLMENKTPDGILIPEYRQADFLLLVEGPYPENELSEAIKKIRDIPSILTAFTIDTSRNRRIDGFYDDIELHSLAIQSGERGLT